MLRLFKQATAIMGDSKIGREAGSFNNHLKVINCVYQWCACHICVHRSMSGANSALVLAKKKKKAMQEEAKR